MTPEAQSISKAFGEAIKQRLRALGVDQNWLARNLGVAPSRVSHALGGKGNLCLETITQFAKAVGLSVNITTK